MKMESGPPPQTNPFICGYQIAHRQTNASRPQGRRDWLFMLTVAGAAYFRSRDADIVVRRGDLLLVEPGAPQYYGMHPEAKSWRDIWVHFQPRGHMLPWLKWPEISPGVRHLVLEGDALGEVQGHLRRMLAAASGLEWLDREQAVNVFEHVLLLCERQNPLRGDQDVDARIRRVSEEMGLRLERAFPLPEMARLAGMSRARFCALFKEQTGLSPGDYHFQRRIERARELLTHTSFTVQEIAVQLGFASPFHFSAMFKRRTGVAPKFFRRESVGRLRL